MKLGLWNIDHPEVLQKASRRNRRFNEISAYLSRQDCDIFVLTEANAAIEIAGYNAYFSTESPYLKKSRCYNPPNQYHQVAIYSRLPCKQIKVAEPINGLLCKLMWRDEPLFIYGNVITIKDQWVKDSNKKYSDRLKEQLDEIERLAQYPCIVAGDFNLRRGWPQKKGAHKAVKQFVEQHNFVWPTENQTHTIQHILHAANLAATFTIDTTVQHNHGKQDGLSDHPYISVDFQL
ncbi:MAG: endonuclease/exonuclease/phosphatase family protein [Cyanobacteria bacterium P01_G01_bin.54]